MTSLNREETNYVNKGHAKRIPPEEAKVTSSKTWYLTHLTMLNPNKPGKVRVVFDAAAKFHGVSLNSELLTGPNLLNNLVGILMRCRREKIMSWRTLNKCSIRFMFLKKIETGCASCGEIYMKQSNQTIII